jgi:hypothetical protein
MRIAFITIIAVLFFTSCNNDDTPDVSNIKIDIKAQRFEEDMFRADTGNSISKLNKLQANYPSFGENFFATILNIDPKWSEDTAANYLNGFLTAYKPVYDSTKKVFTDFTSYQDKLIEGLKFIKYYFPSYKIPTKIITYIGPLDGYGDILSDDAIIVGLQHHLGKNFSLYKSELVQQVYPSYITDRFEPDYISVNAMKNIVLDIFPEKLEDKTLVHQMIEKGKRLYILQKILPTTKPEYLIGYTTQQLKDCYAHENTIWDLFVQNNFLQTIDNNVIKNYIGESPKTQELGEASPGNIGSFVGWQIVRKYMSKNSSTTLQQLMQLDNETLFAEAKYKP